MIEVIKKGEGYWSKSEAFLLPLTGLPKTLRYGLKTYLFWGQYSIENYNLIVKFSYRSKDEFNKYCKKIVFPVLDKNGYLIESHDFDDETILILDISEWALDVEMFLKGRYSKFSGDAKDIIVEYHTYYDKGAKVPIEVIAALEPNEQYKLLEGKTAIEYVAENYGFNIDELKKIGEVGSIYDRKEETLTEILTE